MAERYLGIKGFDRNQVKIVKRTVKAYKKFNLLSNLKKRDGGYKFTISQERFDLLRKEIELSFMEAGLC